MNYLPSALSSEQIKQLSLRAYNCARRKIAYDDVLNTTERLVMYIDYFNVIDEYQVRIMDQDIDDIYVIDEIVPFIQPRSVKLNAADLKCAELLYYSNPEVVEDLNYADFLNTELKWRSYFKKDIDSGVTPLASIKKCLSLSEVIEQAAFICEDDTLVRYKDKPYYPVRLRYWVGQFFKLDTYFDCSMDFLVNDYLSELIFR